MVGTETIEIDGVSCTFLALPCTCPLPGSKVPCTGCEIRRKSIERVKKEIAKARHCNGG